MSALFSLVETDPTEDDITTAVSLAREHSGRWSRPDNAYRCMCGYITDTPEGVARHRHRLLIIQARKDIR